MVILPSLVSIGHGYQHYPLGQLNKGIFILFSFIGDQTQVLLQVRELDWSFDCRLLTDALPITDAWMLPQCATALPKHAGTVPNLQILKFFYNNASDLS